VVLLSEELNMPARIDFLEFKLKVVMSGAVE
jgi:hypothetical protein